MKASELIRSLTAIMKHEGDLNITIWADHGQTSTPANGVGTMLADTDGEVYNTDDDPEDIPDDVQKIIEIYG